MNWGASSFPKFGNYEGYIYYTIFFIRAGFIRAEMMSTENFGKIRAGEYSNLLRYMD